MTDGPAPAGETEAGEIALVCSLVGDTAASDVVFDDEGWDSRVYVVDRGAVAFKFPRTPAVQRGYRDEVAMLRLAESCSLPLPTPRVRWMGPDLSYFGYEGLPGAAADFASMHARPAP